MVATQDAGHAGAARVAAGTARAIWTHPENRGVRGRRLARWLAWQAWQRTVRSPWTIRLHGDVRMICHPHDHITSMAMYYGLYDRAEMRFLLAWLRPGDTFLDVGANVAPYSLLATEIQGVRAVAFEPGTLAQARARANIARNRAEAAVRLAPVAVGDEDGEAVLTADRWATNALADAGYVGEVERVTIVRLDTYTADHGIDGVRLIKIDVEGHEPAVLRGAAGLLAHERPALIVEVNDVDALRGVAEGLGYTRVAYDADTGLLAPDPWPDRPGGNTILVPDLAAATARLAGEGAAAAH